MTTPTVWLLSKEVPLSPENASLLHGDESAYACYEGLHDSALLTTRRIILRKRHGFLAASIKTTSLPYSSIIVWSVDENETPLYSVYEFVTKRGTIVVKFNTSIDLDTVDRILEHHVI